MRKIFSMNTDKAYCKNVSCDLRETCKRFQLGKKLPEVGNHWDIEQTNNKLCTAYVPK